MDGYEGSEVCLLNGNERGGKHLKEAGGKAVKVCCESFLNLPTPAGLAQPLGEREERRAT
jgi:hypothetical protein